MFDMMKNRTLKEITPAYIFAACICHFRPLAKRLSDETLIKIIHRGYVGKKLDLDNPKTYTEKLNWLKLYDRKPLYTTLVDKYEVKKYVAERIGEQHIIPTYGVWESFDDINFESLPDQFVLKCTHDSGGLVIVKNKKELDKLSAKKVIENSLKRNFYIQNREWVYKDVKPRIIAEKYMQDEKTNELRDYKFFCFNGVPKVLFVATGRQTNGPFFDFFDMDYNHLDIINGHPNASEIPEKPITFDEMKSIAKVLSQGFPHIRVDLYEINGVVYFGEITFYHFGGWVPMKPLKWETIFGDWLELPNKTN